MSFQHVCDFPVPIHYKMVIRDFGDMFYMHMHISFSFHYTFMFEESESLQLFLFILNLLTFFLKKELISLEMEGNVRDRDQASIMN